MVELYLDHSATTKVCPPAITAATEAMAFQYGNPSSLHRKGFEAEQLLQSAKKTFSSLLHCREDELLFTSGATESNNLAILGVAASHKRRGKRIVTTAIEHPSVSEPCAMLQQQGFDIVTIHPDKDGYYNPVDFYNAVDDNTILVTAMTVNNETGLQLPIVEIAAAVKRKNKETLVHTDAVQSFLKLPIKLKNTGIDLLSASGHKVYAPKGVGLLYLKKGVTISPLLYGGGQQRDLRVGTESVPMIAAFAAACVDYLPHQKEHLAHYKCLQQYFFDRVQSIPEITLNSPVDGVPYIINFSVEGLRSEVLLHHLEALGIYVSSGSACSKGKKSKVLQALNIPDARIDTALRISFSPEIMTDDLDRLLEGILRGLASLAKLKRIR